MRVTFIVKVGMKDDGERLTGMRAKTRVSESTRNRQAI